MEFELDIKQDALAALKKLNREDRRLVGHRLYCLVT